MKQGIDFHDVLVIPKQSRHKTPLFDSRSNINTTFQNPIIISNMKNIGTYKNALKMVPYSGRTCVNISDLPERWAIDKNLIIPTFSEKEFRDSSLLFKFIDLKPRYICLDVANAYRGCVHELIKERIIHFKANQIKLIVGNVCTYEGALSLYKIGVDIVKVGIGGGSMCLTREVAGIGSPQITAIQEAVRAAKHFSMFLKTKPKIISDGGIQSSADVVKALVAGADYVMVGGLYAVEDGLLYSGSSVLMESSDYKASEGKVVTAKPNKYGETVEEVTEKLLAGLRSAATYLGAYHFNEFRNKGEFIRTSRQLNNMFKE